MTLSTCLFANGAWEVEKFALISSLMQGIQSLVVIKDVHPDDMMNNGPPFYEQTGASALRVVLTAIIARTGYIGGGQPIRNILDFGCGYGRVTRWFKAGFPDSKIYVTDLNRAAARWCAETFSANAPSNVLVENKYDLIFLGSVLTHLPAHKTLELIDQLRASLKNNGILIFTTLGRFGCLLAETNPDDRVHNSINKEGLKSAINSFRNTGYGFVANSSSDDYGNAWSGLRWFNETLGHREDIVQIMFQEKGWNNYQDAYAYLKAPLSEIRRSRY